MRPHAEQPRARQKSDARAQGRQRRVATRPGGLALPVRVFGGLGARNSLISGPRRPTWCTCVRALSLPSCRTRWPACGTRVPAWTVTIHPAQQPQRPPLRSSIGATPSPSRTR
eukprot:Amastigsp_a176098_5.p3 type:complete len:113 gc:universal Amastigsp_a176098_5:442-104(-)